MARANRPIPAYLDHVERYLREADVLDISTFEVASAHAHPTYRVILMGGVGTVAKPADKIADGVRLVGREVAAWVVTKALGWHDLIAVTVQRNLPSRVTGAPVSVSLQVIWPDCLPDAPTERFSEEDTWRAALFDAIVGQADRSGHNWLAVPASASEPRLKLIDHGYSFATGEGRPNSTFFDQHEGQWIPGQHLDAMRSFLTSFPRRDLESLLPSPEVEGVQARTHQLVDRGVLQLP